MKTAFITGVVGQDGAYLAKFLLGKRYKVYGLVRKGSKFENTDYLGVTRRIQFVTGDSTQANGMARLIKKIKPDEVYNFAAQSFVGSSWNTVKHTTDVNSLGVLYLLEAIRKHSPLTKFYQASTSEMFGKNHDQGIHTETSYFHPQSPYAITKLYAYWMTVNYRESYGLFCCNGILFNHESPIRGRQFVTRKISEGVSKIKLGLADEIRLGNLSSERDWGFAGDYVEAMWLMLQQTKPDDFIISTGQTHTIRDFLDVAFRYVGIKDWQRYVIIDSAFKRPKELIVLKGKSDKAQRILHWKPRVKFKQLVEMMVAADLKRLKKG